MKVRFYILCLLLSSAATAWSQSADILETNSRQTLTADGKSCGVTSNNAVMLSVGSGHRADTYLSPMHYDGWAAKIGYEHFHYPCAKSFLWALNLDVETDRTQNPVRNAAMLGAQFEARWAMIWKLSFKPSWLQAGIGGATTLDAGALYLNRNGNNPVAANAAWTIDLTAYGAARFRIGKIPVNALYRATLPVAGAMFAPDYGQLYYEIYLGDSKGIFTGAYWGRYFRLDQRVTLDFKVGKRWLRAGYGIDIQSVKVHDIVSQRLNHMFIIGISTDWLWSCGETGKKIW